MIAVKCRSTQIQIRYFIKFNSLISFFPWMFRLSFNMIYPIFQIWLSCVSRRRLIHTFTSKISRSHYFIYRRLWLALILSFIRRAPSATIPCTLHFLKWGLLYEIYMTCNLTIRSLWDRIQSTSGNLIKVLDCLQIPISIIIIVRFLIRRSTGMLRLICDFH